MKTNKNLYCGNCNKFVNAKIYSGYEKHIVLKEEIKIKTNYYVCPCCKEKVYDEELDSKTIQIAYDAYRKKHNLLSPNEIKEIRKLYGLTQTDFAKLIGCGEKTICRYEGGAIQDEVHNSILRLLKSRYIMAQFATERKSFISKEIYNKIKNVINKSEQTEYKLTKMSNY